MKTRTVVSAVAVLALIHLTPAPAGAEETVSWAGDVEPALASVVCTASHERAGRVMYTPTYSGCAEPPGLSPAMQAVREVLAGRVQVIERLVSIKPALQEAFDAFPGGGADHKDAVLERYRHNLLASPRVQALVMPDVHRALAEHGLACPDCPGPRTRPPARRVTVAELVPYAVAFYWPDAIRPDGGVGLHICVGNNGLARIPKVDPDLADAAAAGMFANMPGVMAATRPLLVEAVKAPAYAAAADAPAKLEVLRATLAARLPATPAFVAAVAAGAAQALPALGLACTDCDALRGAAPSEPAVAPSPR